MSGGEPNDVAQGADDHDPETCGYCEQNAYDTEECSACNGTGERDGGECPECEGHGYWGHSW